MKRSIALIIILLFTAAGCARAPKARSSERIILNYFQKYARKYPATVYKKDPVKKVEVSDTREIHKNMVEAMAFISLESGGLERIAVTIERKHVFWKVISWEKVSGTVTE